MQSKNKNAGWQDALQASGCATRTDGGVFCAPAAIRSVPNGVHFQPNGDGFFCCKTEKRHTLSSAGLRFILGRRFDKTSIPCVNYLAAEAATPSRVVARGTQQP